jgi:hypothetical protein
MPRAAPGVIARGAQRRNLTENLWVSVQGSDRYQSRYPYRSEMETRLHRTEVLSTQRCYFTLHLSGFGVERGRLGEVVSLVGDCRPPPPGNPRQPTTQGSTILRVGGRRFTPARSGRREGRFYLITRINGGFFLPLWMYSTLNNYHFSNILKKLKYLEYFKVNRSYFSCAVKKPVLKFEHFHSHLCGFREVEPPSIAITNVLGT